jgi:peptidoglycan/xylan/chitin deacetylase (PgdA/CDA1 family)
MARIIAHALEGVDPPVAAEISGDPEAVREASAGLPEGVATPEAIVVRGRRSGGELVWGEPRRVGGIAALLRLCRARGVSSVALVRADPSLLSALQIGSWFDDRLFRRLARRAALGTRVTPRLLRGKTATDVAFWSGVRSATTRREWRRLTRSSYVVLLYHRIAGEYKPGQERLDVSPDVFERHMRWLRRLGLRPLAVDELLAFHTNPDATLPPRAILVSADDGFRDAVVALRRHADLRPIVFVSTAAVGGGAPWEWADGEAIASWAELQELVADGGEVGSHAKTHTPLPRLEQPELHDELTQSLLDVQQHVSRVAPLLAYPHGQNDVAVRAAASATGYEAAFSTDSGRNGAGTDRYRLRRIEPKDWDGGLVFAWKALTGEPVPWSVERIRRRLRGRR